MPKYNVRRNGFLTSHPNPKYMSISPTLELLTHTRVKEVVIIRDLPRRNLQTLNLFADWYSFSSFEPAPRR